MQICCFLLNLTLIRNKTKPINQTHLIPPPPTFSPSSFFFKSGFKWTERAVSTPLPPEERPQWLWLQPAQ